MSFEARVAAMNAWHGCVVQSAAGHRLDLTCVDCMQKALMQAYLTGRADGLARAKEIARMIVEGEEGW